MSTTANTLTNIMPKILARGLLTLRQRCVMPRLVNMDYGADAAKKGDTINIPVPVAITASDVTPAETPPAPTATTPGVVSVSLDKWKKAEGFHLSDKNLTEIDRDAHFLPQQMGEAIKALANAVNESIHLCYWDDVLGVYGWYGTAGTTPFGTGVDVQSATQARKILNQQLCPREDRRGVLDFDAEAEALALSTMADAEKIMSDKVKLEGEIGRKYGIDWVADDHVQTHTAGTIDDGETPNGRTCAVNEGSAGDRVAGTTHLNVDNGAAASLTGTIKVGDIISFASHAQTYVVVASTQSSAQYTATSGSTAGYYTADTNAIADLEFYPGLKEAVADDEVITVKDTHVVNMVFHRDAFAFATRPLAVATADLELGSKIMSITDPHTGLSLRLEVSRQYKQTVWEFDILWGCKLVRPELAMRLAG